MSVLKESLSSGPGGVAEDSRGEYERLVRSKARGQTYRVIALRLVILVAFLVFWEYASGRWVDAFLISRPTAIFDQFFTWVGDGTLLRHSLRTLSSALIGLLIGGTAAIIFGYLLGISVFWARVMDPFIAAMWSLPVAAFVPILIIWVGIGSRLAIAIAALIVFFMMFFNTFAGVRDVDDRLIRAVKTMGGTNLDIAFRVQWPSALVWVVAGAKLSVPRAFVGVVLAEILASNEGLGWLVSTTASQFFMAGSFAAFIGLIILGLAIDRTVVYSSSRALAWKDT